jgi:WD40 repeat protein
LGTDEWTVIGSVGTLAAIVVAVLGIWLDYRSGKRLRLEQMRSDTHHAETRAAEAAPAPFSNVPPLPTAMVERSRLTGELLRALLDDSSALCAVEGPGGFGKSTVAASVTRHPDVAGRFTHGVLWLALGRQTTGAALAAKINGLSELISGTRPTLLDPEQAGLHLRRVVGDRPTLLVLDDACSQAQLRAVSQDVGGLRLLVTTRAHNLVPAGTPTVVVQDPERAEASAMLRSGIEDVVSDVSSTALLALTGRWPVLLALVNKSLKRELARGSDGAAALAQVEARILAAGPGAFDSRQLLDRDLLAAGTIEASISFLAAADASLYESLGIFAEGADIPVEVLHLLWGAHGLDRAAVHQLREDLEDLSLVESRAQRPPAIRLHAVFRAYLRQRAGADRLAALNARLAEDLLAQLEPVDGSSAGEATPVFRYPWEHVAFHLSEGGRHERLVELLSDLDYVSRKLVVAGVAALEADFAFTRDPRALELHEAVRPAAHLLAETLPSHALPAVLLSRLETRPSLRRVTGPFRERLPLPAFINRVPPPDRPDARLRRVLHGHESGVWQARPSPDSTWCVSVSDDGTARVWEMGTGRLRRVIETGGSLWSCAVSPDQRWFVTGGADGDVRLWDSASGDLLKVLRGHTAGVWDCALSPDGRVLITASDDETVRVWSTTSDEVRVLSASGTGGAWACATNGTHAVVGYANGDVRIWDLSTGVATILTGHEAGVWSCAMTADGSVVLSAGDDQTARVWDVSDPMRPTLRHVLRGHTGWIRGCAMDVSGQVILTGGADRRIRIWNAVNGELRGTLYGHTGWIRGLQLSSDGALAVSTSLDATLRVWDLQAEAANEIAGETAWLTGCAVSPSSDWMVTVGAGRGVEVINLTNGQVVRTLGSRTESYWACTVSRDGTQLVTAASDGIVRVWDARTWDLRHKFDVGGAGAFACSMSADSSKLATLTVGRTVQIWDLTHGTPASTLECGPAVITACALEPAGTWLVTGGADGMARIWDTRTGNELRTFSAGPDLIRACAVTPDGRLAVITDDAGAIKILDVQTFAIQHVVRHDAAAIRSCSVSPSGTTLLTCGDDATVRLWDLATAKLRSQLRGHTGRVLDCSMSADDVAVSIGEDRTIRVWDLRTGHEQMVIDGERLGTTALGVEPRGHSVAVAHADGSVRMSDLRTGAQTPLLPPSHRTYRTCDLTPDGAHLLLTDNEGRTELRTTIDGSLLRTTHTSKVGARTTAIDPAGQWFAVGMEDSTVTVWSMADWTQIHVLEGLLGWVRSCAVSPEGDLVAAASDQSAIQIWDTRSWTLQRTVPRPTARFQDCGFAGDGRWFWVAGGERVTLWDTATWRVRGILEDPGATVVSCSASPSGQLLVSVTACGVVRGWDVDNLNCVATMRVDGRLHGCTWRPGTDEVLVFGERGVYWFSLARDQDATQKPLLSRVFD